MQTSSDERRTFQYSVTHGRHQSGANKFVNEQFAKGSYCECVCKCLYYPYTRVTINLILFAHYSVAYLRMGTQTLVCGRTDTIIHMELVEFMHLHALIRTVLIHLRSNFEFRWAGNRFYAYVSSEYINHIIFHTMLNNHKHEMRFPLLRRQLIERHISRPITYVRFRCGLSHL